MLYFRQDILKTVKCPQVCLCGAFLPESVRDHRMEKHDGMIHIRVITLQISPWKCFWYRSDRCHYTHVTLGCHCIKVNVENWQNLRDTFDRIKLASISFIRCNQATQADGENEMGNSTFTASDHNIPHYLRVPYTACHVNRLRHTDTENMVSAKGH